MGSPGYALVAGPRSGGWITRLRGGYVLVVLVVDIDAANPNCTLECVLDLLLSASHPTPRRARTCRRRPLHNPLFRNELGVSQKHLENGVFQSLVRKGATAHHL